MKKLLSILSFSSLMLPSFAQAEVVVDCGKGNRYEHTVNARAGETMAVVARGNPTMGITWVSLDNIEPSVRDDGGPVGSSGTYNFKKRLNASDDGKVFTFVYRSLSNKRDVYAVCRVEAVVR